MDAGSRRAYWGLEGEKIPSSEILHGQAKRINLNRARIVGGKLMNK